MFPRESISILPPTTNPRERRASLHYRRRQGADRGVAPRISIKNTEISRPEDQAPHHPLSPPLLT